MYRLTIKTIDDKTLTFFVKEYSLENGHFIFIDNKTGLKKSFPADRASAEESEA